MSFNEIVLFLVGLFFVIAGLLFFLKKRKQEGSKEELPDYLDTDKTVPDIDFVNTPYGKVVVIESGAETRFFPIPEEGLIIGRDPNQADLVIQNRYVSKAHARIMPKGDEYLLIDLASTNGTFVNGERITEKKVKGDEEILLGKSGVIKIRIVK